MGSFQSAIREAFPPASKFSTDDIPDLTGKVIIVTGANAGVGKETAKASVTAGASDRA
jgi:retinol dehydrogenase 12